MPAIHSRSDHAPSDAHGERPVGLLLDGTGDALQRRTAVAWEHTQAVAAAYACGPLAWGRPPARPIVKLTQLTRTDSGLDHATLLRVLQASLGTDDVELVPLGQLEPIPAHAILADARLLFTRDEPMRAFFTWTTILEALDVHRFRTATETQWAWCKQSCFDAHYSELMRSVLTLRTLAKVPVHDHRDWPSPPASVIAPVPHMSAALTPTPKPEQADNLIRVSALFYSIQTALRVLIEATAQLSAQHHLRVPAHSNELLLPLSDGLGLDQPLAQSLQRRLRLND